jgi:hypothetical protein
LTGLTANSGGFLMSMPATNILVNAPYWGYPQPQLSRSTLGALCWPTNVPGYTPQVSATLGAQADWKKLTNGVLEIKDGYYLYTPDSNELPRPQGYFRLAFPDR